VFVSSIVCVLLPRFELVVACGDREALLRHPTALAPEPGREQLVGEVSRAAEGFGIHPGMRMGEALARCPRLALVPPDPIGVADVWERVLARLEAVGAQVEPGGSGLACFEARGLRRLHGGSLDGVLRATREALARPARLGAGPSRFCAVVAAAAKARARRPGLVAGAADLAGEPVALLRHRQQTAALPEALERALVLLVDRLLARRERDGRMLRVVVLGAALVEGGTWRERVVFREPLSDPVRMRLALGQRLALLPAPAERLRLTVERFGPAHPAEGTLFADDVVQRRARLREAVRQARATAGPQAALRVLTVDPDSRVPERRAVLTPFEP
jgi:protein ImuB